MPYLYMTDDHDMSTDILKPFFIISSEENDTPGNTVFDLYMVRLHKRLFRDGPITSSVDIDLIAEDLRRAKTYDRFVKAYEGVFYLKYCKEDHSILIIEESINDEYKRLRVNWSIDTLVMTPVDAQTTEMTWAASSSSRLTQEFAIDPFAQNEINTWDCTDTAWRFLDGTSGLLLDTYEDDLPRARLHPIAVAPSGSSSSRSFIYCDEVKDHHLPTQLLQETTDVNMFLVNQADKLGEPTVQGPSSLDLSDDFSQALYTKLSVDEAQQSLEDFLAVQKKLSAGYYQGYKELDMRGDEISEMVEEVDDKLGEESCSIGMRWVEEDIDLSTYPQLVEHRSVFLDLLDTLDSLVYTKYSDLPTFQTATASVIEFVNRCIDGRSIVVNQTYTHLMEDSILFLKIIMPFVLRLGVMTIVKKKLIKMTVTSLALRRILTTVDNFNWKTCLSAGFSCFREIFKRSSKDCLTNRSSSTYNVTKAVLNKEIITEENT